MLLEFTIKIRSRAHWETGRSNTLEAARETLAGGLGGKGWCGAPEWYNDQSEHDNIWVVTDGDAARSGCAILAPAQQNFRVYTLSRSLWLLCSLCQLLSSRFSFSLWTASTLIFASLRFGYTRYIYMSMYLYTYISLEREKEREEWKEKREKVRERVGEEGQSPPNCSSSACSRKSPSFLPSSSRLHQRLWIERLSKRDVPIRKRGRIYMCVCVCIRKRRKKKHCQRKRSK